MLEAAREWAMSQSLEAIKDAEIESGQALQAASAPVVPRACLDSEDHREHTFSELSVLPALVAKKVPRSQWNTPEAKAALDKERKKLLAHTWPDGKGVGTWDESRVEEASVMRERVVSNTISAVLPSSST